MPGARSPAADPYQGCPSAAQGPGDPPDTPIALPGHRTAPMAGCDGPRSRGRGVARFGQPVPLLWAPLASLRAGFANCARLPECAHQPCNPAPPPLPPPVNDAAPTAVCRRPAQQRQPRHGAAPVRAAYAQIGHTDRTHESMNGPGSAYRPGGTQKKLPIAYSPEWMALREHTKEIDNLWVLLGAAGCWVLHGALHPVGAALPVGGAPERCGRCRDMLRVIFLANAPVGHGELLPALAGSPRLACLSLAGGCNAAGT